MLRRRKTGGEAAPPLPVAGPTAMPSVGAATTGTRYRMVEKLVSVGDDFFIQNDLGERVFEVDGKALRLRDTLYFRDIDGNEVCRIQQRVARIRDTMEVEGPDGRRLAMIHKAMITPLRDRYVISVEGGHDLDVQGNILAHEYRIGDVATVSKKWFRVRDSYGVEIAPGQNDILILAATVCIDQMSSDRR
jgi:uncharacterized protein YxjI